MLINREQCEKRIKEIDIELKKLHSLFGEYHNWTDKETQKAWFPLGRYFNYDEMVGVEREHELLTERKAINEQIKSA
jgi:hypothetical protein